MRDFVFHSLEYDCELFRLACDSAIFVVLSEVDDGFVNVYLRVHAFVVFECFLVFNLAHTVAFELHNLFGSSEDIVFDNLNLLVDIEKIFSRSLNLCFSF